MKSANAAEKARHILESKQTVLVFGGGGRGEVRWRGLKPRLPGDLCVGTYFTMTSRRVCWKLGVVNW